MKEGQKERWQRVQRYEYSPGAVRGVRTYAGELKSTPGLEGNFPTVSRNYQKEAELAFDVVSQVGCWFHF